MSIETPTTVTTVLAWLNNAWRRTKTGEPLSAPAAGRCAQPYVGPCPFKEEHVGIFFGRNREIEDLVSLVLAHTEVLLYSQSGAGKSSLIQAGLIPVLKSVEKCEILSARVQGQLADIDLHRSGDFNPFVFHTLLSWEGETDIDQSRLAHLWQMSSSDGSLAEYLAQKAAPTDEDDLPLPRVLIFDQFEELFTTYPQYWRQRKGFFVQVRAALKRDPNLHVLFAMREEYLASLDPYAPLLPEKLGTRYRLQRMRPAAAKAAIERPLVGTGRCFAPGVVDEVVLKDLLAVEIDTPQGPQTITEDYIEPVQLQVVCQNLWRGLGPTDKEITSGQVQKSGANVNQALRNFYEDALRTVVRQTKADETTLRLWFEDKLITPTSTRSTVFAGESEVDGMPLAVVRALQDLYLVRGEQRARGSWYELTHDRLISPIRASNKAYVERHVLSFWFHRHRRKLLTFYLPIFLCLATFLVIQLVIGIRAERESRRRGVELNVSQGMRLLEKNEHAEALLRLSKALEDEVDERHKANHLARLMTVFGQFPRLTNCWFYEGDDAPDDAPFTVDDGRLSQDGRLALLAMNQITNKTNDGTRTRQSVGMARIYDAAGSTEAHLIEYRMRADRQVKSARFSHDGKWVVTASMSSKEDMGDGEAQVWPVPGAGAPTSTDEPFAEQLFKGQGVTFANFHPKNSRRIIFGCSKGTAVVWDTEQKTRVELDHGKVRVNNADFSPTEAKEELIVTASGDPGEAGEVRVYWAATGKRRWAKKLRGAVKFVAFSPDGRLVVSASEDAAGGAGEVQLWDAEVGDWKGGWKHAGAALHAVFSPDGRYILSSSEDSTAVLWDRDKQEKKHAFQHGSHVYCAAFSPDGRHAITACRDRAARVWNVATGALALPPVHHNGSVQTAVFSPDGRHALTTGYTSAQHWDLWPLDSKDASTAVFPKLLRTDGWANQTPNGPRGPYVLRAARTPDEQVEAAIWDAANGRSIGPAVTLPPDVTFASISEQGKYALAITQLSKTAPQAVHLWEASSKTPIRLNSPVPKDYKITYAAFGAKGHLAVGLAKDSKNGAMTGKQGKVWLFPILDVLKEGDHKPRITEFDNAVAQVAFSPNGDLLAAVANLPGKEGEVHLLDVATGEINRIDPVRHKEDILAVSFSRDSKRIVTASVDDDARVWSTLDGKAQTKPLKHTADVLYAAVDRAGKLVVTASYDGTAAVWDLATSDRLYTLKHGKPVTYAAFSSDGQRVVTASQDATVKVWDVEPGAPRTADSAKRTILIATFKHPGRVHFADFLGDANEGIVTVCYGAAPVESHGASPHDAWSEPSGALQDGLDLRHVEARIWSFVPQKQRPSDAFLALLLSGRKLENDEIHPLTGSELAKAWKAFAEQPSATVPGDADATRRWHQRQAIECETAHQWFAASWHLKRQMDGAPDADLAELHDRLGRALLAQGAATASLAEFQKAINDALAEYQKAITRQPNNWQFYLHRAQAYEAGFHHDKSKKFYVHQAAGAYQDAIALRKADWRLWHARARVLAVLGPGFEPEAIVHYAKALNLLNDAIAARPETRDLLNRRKPAIQVGLANSYEKLHQWDKAIDTYDQDKQDKQEDWRLYRGRAMALAAKALEIKSADDQKQKEDYLWRQAIENYTRAIDLKPGHSLDEVELLVGRAKARAKFSEASWDEIAKDYGAALDLGGTAWYKASGVWYAKPFAPDINLHSERAENRWRSLLVTHLAVLSSARSEPLMTVALLAEERTRASLVVQDYTAAAQEFDKRFRRADANTHYTKAIYLDPDNADIRALRAATRTLDRQWSLAAEDYASAVRLGKDDPALLAECARAHARLGKWEDTVDYYQRALKLDKSGCNAPLRIQAAGAFAERAIAHVSGSTNPARVPALDAPKEKSDLAQAAALLLEAIDCDPLYQKNVSLRGRLAVLRLALNDVAAYRSICAKMLEDFHDTKDAPTANNVAWTCALGPKAVADYDGAVRLAQMAKDEGVGSKSNRLNTLGAVLCRAGKFAEAAETLGQSRKQYAVETYAATDQGSMWDQFFLAFAIHGMGHPEIARVWLDRAIESGNRLPRDAGDTFQEPPAWELQLSRWVWQRELESLLSLEAP